MQKVQDDTDETSGHGAQVYVPFDAHCYESFESV
jgi:hypothetical protein